jgi:hypothetical protein
VQRIRQPEHFEVGADGRGVTGRAGTGLLAQVADRIGVTAALSATVTDCRRWLMHDPGVVVRDLVLTLADGGNRAFTAGLDDRRTIVTLRYSITKCA